MGKNIPVETKPFAIRELLLPDALSKSYSTDLDSPVLTELSRLNVFIGPNNSGKSRMMRSLFSAPVLARGFRDEESEAIRKSVRDLICDFPTSNPKIIKELRNKIPLLYGKSYEKCGSGSVGPDLRSLSSEYVGDRYDQVVRLVDRVDTIMSSGEWRTSSPDLGAFVKIYIPTLRGLRRPKSDSHFYSDRTKIDYFGASGEIRTWMDMKPEQYDPDSRASQLNVHTGLEMYDIVRSHLLGSLPMRDKISQFQKFMSKTFYGGADFALIPREGSDVLFAKIGCEEERPIYELGDGVQHILIMMLPLFIHQDKNLLLFIEEPELYLHPGFQRILIDAFLDNDDVSRQVFVTSHSNHFLDITVDRQRCSVYKVKKTIGQETTDEEATFHVSTVSNDDFSILAELGVRNSSVMLSNCTVWVEGVWDRLYLRHFLSIWQKHHNKKKGLREDLHYSFVEYGGSCIEHWSFLDDAQKPCGIDVDRLCGTLFLIADRDGDAKKDRHDRIEKVLGSRFYRLGCREIENMLTPDTIRSVVHHYEGEEIELKQFRQKDYEDEYLGAFIETHVLPAGCVSKRTRKESTRPYADASGTVKDKERFCHWALSFVKGIEHLSPEAISLCEKVYAFIESQNA